MAHKRLCRMKSLAFRGCSLIGLALVSLFCTLNRSSVWQVVYDFSVDSKTEGMMPALPIIPDQLRCYDCQDLNACIGFDGGNKFDGFSQDGLIIGGSHGGTGFMIIVLVVKAFVPVRVKE